MSIPKQIKIWVEISGGNIANVPEWVKTKEDLQKFAEEYADLNMCIGYDVL